MFARQGGFAYWCDRCYKGECSDSTEISRLSKPAAGFVDSTRFGKHCRTATHLGMPVQTSGHPVPQVAEFLEARMQPTSLQDAHVEVAKIIRLVVSFLQTLEIKAGDLARANDGSEYSEEMSDRGKDGVDDQEEAQSEDEADAKAQSWWEVKLGNRELSAALSDIIREDGRLALNQVADARRIDASRPSTLTAFELLKLCAQALELDASEVQKIFDAAPTHLNTYGTFSRLLGFVMALAAADGPADQRATVIADLNINRLGAEFERALVKETG